MDQIFWALLSNGKVVKIVVR